MTRRLWQSALAARWATQPSLSLSLGCLLSDGLRKTQECKAEKSAVQVIARGLGGRIGKNTSGRFALTGASHPSVVSYD